MIREIVFLKPSRTFNKFLVILMLFTVSSVLLSHTFAQGAQGDQPRLVVVVESTKSFPETLKSFKEEVSKGGWSVLNAHNMAGVLSERGFTLHPVVILDVCSGKYSARILSKDEYRPVSAFMPCRVGIYKTSDGKVFITRMNTAAFAKMMPPEVAEVMVMSDEEVAKIIAKSLL